MKSKPCRCCSGSGKELDSKSVGRAMRQLRADRHLPQLFVARKMGFSSAYVSQLEQGLRDWSRALIKQYRTACES